MAQLGCGNAVGDKMIYSFTITVSPYKKFANEKHGPVAYKSLDIMLQKEVIYSFLMTYREVNSVNYEICPTSHNVHCHGTTNPITYEEKSKFENDMWKIFGYQGRHNKIEHTIVMKVCDPDWIDYQTKEESGVYDVWTFIDAYPQYYVNVELTEKVRKEFDIKYPLSI